MVNAIRKAAEVRIDLENDTILMLGHPDESAGKMLRGTLYVIVHEPIKVKSIHLRFQGRMKVSWSEGVGHHQHHYKQEKTILEHDWQFIPMANIQHQQKKSYCLSAGEHKFNFELMLPGDIPESLETIGGQVSYRLKAIVERSTFVNNISKKKYVKIVRSMLPSEFSLHQSMEIHNTWVDKMMYDITMPSKLYALGEKIHLSINILPIATDLKVKCMNISLKEYCSYTISDNSKTDTRLIMNEKVVDPFPESYDFELNTWKKDITMTVPTTSPSIFCDTENDMIKISHKMKFIISLINADGHYSELRCAVPVVIIDSLACETENMLPSYDQTWRTVPYDPSVFEALRRRPSLNVSSLPPTSQTPISLSNNTNANAQREPVTMAGRSRNLSISTISSSPNIRYLNQLTGLNNTPPTSSSFNSNNNNGDPWWQGMDLSRVPSYNTAKQLDHVALSSSLPAYEQLSISPRC
ncbi:unnamed protein product [Cunninghamella blakesleeana]